MKTFLDVAGNKVDFSFLPHSFPEEARHVLVICRYAGGWLLTRHKKRGLEFPGGKLEAGETLEAAARREVYEETGAAIDELLPIAEYRVSDPKGAFVKVVFYSQVEQLEEKSDYLETAGPVVVHGDLASLRFNKEYSFIMKDQVMAECLKQIAKWDEIKE